MGLENYIQEMPNIEKTSVSDLSEMPESEKPFGNGIGNGSLTAEAVASIYQVDSFEGAGESGDITLQQKIENGINCISAHEKLQAENWNTLALRDKLAGLQDFANQYANDSWCGEVKIASSSLLNYSPDIVALGVESDILFNESLLENNTITPEIGVAAIIKNCEAGRNISFGRLTRVAELADLQCGGTCWLEACENLAQLHASRPLGNNFSTLLYNEVSSNHNEYGAFIEDDAVFGKLYNIPCDQYSKLLQKAGINTSWQTFSHENLQKALAENKAVLVCGSAGCLPGYDENAGGHAFVVTDYKDGKYFGLDSNFFKQTVAWTPAQLENSIKAFAPQNPQILVPENEATWVYKTNSANIMAINASKDTLSEIESSINEKFVQPIKDGDGFNNFNQQEKEILDAVEKIDINYLQKRMDVVSQKLRIPTLALKNSAVLWPKDGKNNAFFVDYPGRFYDHYAADPELFQDFAAQVARLGLPIEKAIEHFVDLILAHEAGHFIFSQCAVKFPRAVEEYCCDMMSGIYAGEAGIPTDLAKLFHASLEEGDGCARVFDDKTKEWLYPSTNERLQAIDLLNNYPFNDFIKIGDEYNPTKINFNPMYLGFLAANNLNVELQLDKDSGRYVVAGAVKPEPVLETLDAAIEKMKTAIENIPSSTLWRAARDFARHIGKLV